jgi:signal transduction protein with GAF and PtsI domain
MQERIAIMHAERSESKTDVEWIHEIGGHVAAGNTLDEALAATVDFAVELINCDLCFIYVRDGAELALWVWKHLNQGKPEHPKVPLGRGYTALLAQHQVPIAVSTHSRDLSEARILDKGSAEIGETFVSVPLLARKELVGMINLQHHQPRRYSVREVNLLSLVGLLLGADIGISRFETQNSDLLMELETRKFVERGKGILQRDLGLSAEEAYLRLQQQSQQKRKSMKEIAQAVILGDEFRRSALTEPTKYGAPRLV